MVKNGSICLSHLKFVEDGVVWASECGMEIDKAQQLPSMSHTDAGIPAGGNLYSVRLRNMIQGLQFRPSQPVVEFRGQSLGVYNPKAINARCSSLGVTLTRTNHIGI